VPIGELLCPGRHVAHQWICHTHTAMRERKECELHHCRHEGEYNVQLGPSDTVRLYILVRTTPAVHYRQHTGERSFADNDDDHRKPYNAGECNS
jgi:hypothetical protein